MQTTYQCDEARHVGLLSLIVFMRVGLRSLKYIKLYVIYRVTQNLRATATRCQKMQIFHEIQMLYIAVICVGFSDDFVTNSVLSRRPIR